MRIETVSIRNFRSLKDITIEVADYAVFIGANGSGKSSVLYALDWFFNETVLAETDVHGYTPDSALSPDTTVDVTVTFADLTAKDRERLGLYGRGDKAIFRSTWYPSTKQKKLVGNAKQGPGFAMLRAEEGVAERRRKYRDLRSTLTDLPDLGNSASKDDILAALTAWESEAAHASRLEDVADVEAKHAMGWNGPNVLRECVRFVLIPAATSISGEVGIASKGSALTELVGAFMAAASARAQEEWLQRHAAVVAELSGAIRSSIETATGVQADRINSRLATLVPNASVVLTTSVPEFSPKVDPSIATAVTIDGITNDVSRQGHGVQRAVMISMFQAIVPDEDLARTTHVAVDGEDEATSRARLEESVAGLPSIIVAIEEPEIYQHPIRARSFARTLVELSQQATVQVVLATHSPYFVQPEQFAALHRFSYASGKTRVQSASVTSVSASSGIAADKVEKAISAHVPTEFSEGFFAEAVGLVEGQTDRVVIEAVAARLGKHLDRYGVTIASVDGKAGIRVARAILQSLGVPTYVLADGDHGTAAHKYPTDQTKQAAASASHKAETDGLVASLPSASTVFEGSLPYAFGDPTVVCADFTIWKDDLEEELSAWTSFESALSSAGISLASRANKNLLSYRNAAMSANDGDIPQVLKSAVDALIASTSLMLPGPAGATL